MTKADIHPASDRHGAAAPLLAALPFLLSFLIPLSAAIALLNRGAWSFATVILVFVITPPLERLLGLELGLSMPDDDGAPPQRRLLFDAALWTWTPIQVALIGGGMLTLVRHQLAWWEILGLVLSVGISSGAGGLKSAWRLESARVAQRGRGRFGLGDRRLRYALELAALLTAITLGGGAVALAFFLAQGLVALLPPLWRRIMHPRVAAWRRGNGLPA